MSATAKQDDVRPMGEVVGKRRPQKFGQPAAHGHGKQDGPDAQGMQRRGGQPVSNGVHGAGDDEQQVHHFEAEHEKRHEQRRVLLPE